LSILVPDKNSGGFVRTAAARFFKLFEALLRIFSGEAVGFLQLAEELIPVAVGESDVIVAQASPGFLDLSAELSEFAFYLVLIHGRLLVVKVKGDCPRLPARMPQRDLLQLCDLDLTYIKRLAPWRGVSGNLARRSFARCCPVAYQAYNEQNQKKYGQYLGNLRERAGKPPKTKDAREYGQHEKSYNVIQHDCSPLVQAGSWHEARSGR
jgi:hypothetical protein